MTNLTMYISTFITTRCYVSTVYAMAVCLCASLPVTVSITSQSSTKMAQLIEVIFGMEASFHLAYTEL